ncbi:DUF4349 domain-containing protein [Myxococcota bacterium]|nr:DUF4349 domain-containing protein [Myxococcota bacterium]
MTPPYTSPSPRIRTGLRADRSHRGPLLALLLLPACMAARPAGEPPEPHSEAPASAPVGTGEEATGATGETGGDRTAAPGAEEAGAVPAATDRKLIRTGAVSLTVGTWDPFSEALAEQVRTLGGFIGDSDTRRSEREVVSSRVTVRVPAERFEALVAWVQRQGVATSVQIDVQDVTDQWTDVEARLANARRLESRILELLASRAASLKDVIEVERELARVRETIEQMEGRRRLLRDQIGLSTLVLDVTVTERWTPPVDPSVAQRAKGAFLASVQALGGLGRGLVVLGAGALPWVAVLGGLGWLFVRGVGRALRGPGRRRGDPG